MISAVIKRMMQTKSAAMPFLLAWGLLGRGQGCLGQGTELYELPPLNYSSTTPQDAVAQIQNRVAAGQLKWSGGGRSVLEALLKELQIPVASQILVFSKTSFQRQRISPTHPRALYFTDTSYVGWVPDGLIEVTTIDPKLGPVFYSFDPDAAEPRFSRDSNCLTCHGGTFVRGIPGVFVRSVFTDETGEPLLRHGSQVVDFRTPFTNRWAGWYVTGKHGTALHHGNTLAQQTNGQLVVSPERGANITSLSNYFSTAVYPSAGSDIVALMVFEHQTAMQNTLTRAALDTRRMIAYQTNLQKELKEPVTDTPTYDSVKHVFDGAAQAVTDDLLFKGEAAVPGGLAGDPSFQTAFCRNAPRTDDGLSLKDLSLQGQLFKNRCSYLIYSPAFASLPGELKRRIYERLRRALSTTDADPRYAYIPAVERKHIARILEQTLPEFRQDAKLR